MTDEYTVDVREEKGTLNIGANPWYTEILVTIFVGIPLTIFSALIWTLGNGFYFIFIKPFEKRKGLEDLKWTGVFTSNTFTLERSEPSNSFLTKEHSGLLDEDAVYFLRTKKEIKEINENYFTDFITEFDNKVFLQRIVPINEDKKVNIICELVYIDLRTLEYKPIKHFDYYYLTSVVNDNSLTITGTDQIGSKLNLRLTK